MRLVVKKGDQTFNVFRFEKGPVYIGRNPGSEVFLPDGAVSRKHAVIVGAKDGRFIIQDMKSANKTYLNGRQIQRAQLKSGDQIRIACFTMDVFLEDEAAADKNIHLADTLIQTPSKSAVPSASGVIVRKADADSGPDIVLPAGRIKDFLQATETICKSNGPDELLDALLKVTRADFDAYRVWAALRNLPDGPMTYHSGKSRDGDNVELENIKLNKKINESIDRQEFVLIPQVSAVTRENKIRSAMIAPIIDPDGCFGVIYIDNAPDQQTYTLSDLDYLMLLAIHTAAIVENF